MFNLNKILLFCFILVLSLELSLADSNLVEHFEITFKRGEYSEKVLPNVEIKERLQCIDENAYYCKKYPLNTVNCKHGSSGFKCSSPDMPFLVTFKVQQHVCRTKIIDNIKFYHPSSCYMRYSLMRNWLLIIGFIVAIALIVLTERLFINKN